MDRKSEILSRLLILFIGFVVFSFVVIGAAVNIQIFQGSEWKAKSEQMVLDYKKIEAVRGNILSSDGSFLATSVPFFELRVDMNTEQITDEIFNSKVDSLAQSLAKLFKDKSASEYKTLLKDARNKKDRYALIQRNASFLQYQEVQTFPIFNMGKVQGGLVSIQKNKRVKPFNILAARTIGKEDENSTPYGIEAAYSTYLQGHQGLRLMQKISGGMWKPVNDDYEIDPEDGSDVVTTIDINLQAVAQNELLRQLRLHNADHGCVVLMEVKTGDIKAIANLKRNEVGTYTEGYNYAIGESTEPGSTFKLASYIAALEDGYIDLNDTVNTAGGKVKFYDVTMKDSREGGYGVITVKEAFQYSSNVAISKIIWKYYRNQPERFIERLHKMHLNSPLGIELPGEGIPRIKSPKDKDWSGISLPWMSIGYECSMTPLQILTFYNAIANDGKMVKPRFVKEIRKRGKVSKEFPIVVIDNHICSKETVKKARQMLEGVVQSGTASNLKHANYSIAGKTGTAQISNTKYGYKSESKVSYQASFVGYFPADNPKYSCIVVVNAPSNNVYYGNLVAGPIFKAVSDKVFATSLDLHPRINNEMIAQNKKAPYSKNGFSKDLLSIFNQMNVNSKVKTDADWVTTQSADNLVIVQSKNVEKQYLPDVKGMGARDAIFLLESLGCIVKISGKGTVKYQSVTAGTPLKKGMIINLELS